MHLDIICEDDDCTRPATTAWICLDSDGGEIYQTNRCDQHPDDLLDYDIIQLRQFTLVSEPLDES